MKFTSPNNEGKRFSGTMRYYHRVDCRPRRTWEEWVGGKAPATKRPRNWLKISAIVAAALSLCGIIAGLIIELS